MSRTRRSLRWGSCGYLEFCAELFGYEFWKVHRDGPANLGPGREFKKNYRRRARRMWKKIDTEETRPVVKNTVEWDFW